MLGSLMKTKRFNGPVAAAFLVALSFFTALNASAVIVTNGDFETLTAANPVGTYLTVNNSATTITGWSVGNISVDVVNGAYNAISGNSIDLAGTPGPGSLSQTFTLAAGSYQLSFDLGRNTDDAPYANVVLGSTNFGTKIGGTGATFIHYVLPYVSAGGATTLSFTNLGTPGGGILDNVSVTAVPEPENYAMMLAGLGLIGFVAHRRAKRGATA